MPFPEVSLRPGPKALSAALRLAGFSDTVFLPAVTDKVGVTWSRPSELQIALAVVGGESSGHAWAYHQNKNGSTDWGAGQINSTAHPAWFGPVTDPAQLNWANYYDNAQMMFTVYRNAGRKFTPWNAFTNGGYLKDRFEKHSWMHWAAHGVTLMQALVKQLMAGPPAMDELSALQEVASVNWDALRYWQ